MAIRRPADPLRHLLTSSKYVEMAIRRLQILYDIYYPFKHVEMAIRRPQTLSDVCHLNTRRNGNSTPVDPL